MKMKMAQNTMTDFADITITGEDVKVDAAGSFCEVYFTLSRYPDDAWCREFGNQYEISGYSPSERIGFTYSTLVLRTLQEFVGPDIRRKIKKDVDSTNQAMRQTLTRMAEEQVKAEERQRHSEEAKRQREAELKRKLLGDE